MMRFARTLVAMTLILGVTDMASAKNERGYFEIRSGSGQTNPAPNMVITDDGKTLSYYSRGRELDHSSQGRYLGIGKYTVESSDTYARQLAEIRLVLSKRDAAVRDAVSTEELDPPPLKVALNLRQNPEEARADGTLLQRAVRHAVVRADATYETV